MGFYNNHVLPGLTHLVCSQQDIARQRRKIVPKAFGRILEIGMGSGLNLPYYNPAQVDQVWGLDPSVSLTQMASKKAAQIPFKVDFITLSAEQIPLDKNSADTIVVTYTLCSIPDVSQALKEMNRVLKPGGRLLFCDHGRAAERSVTRWQDALTPFWKQVSGGCHLNRPIASLIENSGFKFQHLDMAYMSPLKIISFNYWGAAVCA
jgi:ubiquinone/menaquinone biosynthesis C-methylase UbiE